MSGDRTLFQCVVCGKITAGRLPRAHGREYGDGTARFPRRHRHDGGPCPGNTLEARWVDVDDRGNVIHEGGS